VATNGQSALAQVKINPPDLILLDIMMPGMDGYEVCTQLKSDEATSLIPIIFISAMHEAVDKSKGFDLGAVDYVTKPFQIAEVQARVRTHIALKQAIEALSNQNQILETKVKERTLALRDTQLEIIFRLSRAAEYRDNETGLHIKRMSHFTQIISAAMNCSEDTCALLFNASPMHDVGKIGIPDHILLKPSRLDPDEWRIMKTHTTIGAEMLAGHDSVLLQTARIIALTHHEKWDGSGYPSGLSKEEIPLSGRIVAICDVFDALTSQRPYKRAWPVEEALREIKTGSGSAFDPATVDALFRSLPALLSIKECFKDKIS
jgi:putative two-component system response regulator